MKNNRERVIRMTNFKGAIFDMDGTLLDSMGLWSDIDREFLAKRGIDVPSDYLQAVIYLGAMGTALYTIDRFNLSDTPEGLIAEWNSMAAEKYKTIPEKPGALEYLEYLNGKGVQIALATATDIKLVNAALEDRKLNSYIGSITTVPEVGIGKESPDIYLKACEKMNLKPSECIVFEDILIGIQTAKKAGFAAVAMHDDFSGNNERQIRLTADKYISDFREMM